jgi:hypothetical protein
MLRFNIKDQVIGNHRCLYMTGGSNSCINTHQIIRNYGCFSPQLGITGL